MLELRPNCEHCNIDLSPDATTAMICSFECTFCRNCVEKHLSNVCPNCGGGFTLRPIRPSRNWNNQNDLHHHPAIESRTHKPVNLEYHRKFSAPIVKIKPQDR
ncbi:DUF1272 domain-containing protein [Motiliproteus sp. MSK22-1]|uniref:DUF1272 domain-containing protein n=1 Tax=Motiliproteus sp. MSK22-1 TaxID=1897630 RepID=UPI000978B86E|nr:DUF1272 domain-containing protein [Motiliproteus sp. MSK22-1]